MVGCLEKVNNRGGSWIFEELGIGGGTFLILCIVGYYLLKWAIRNGLKEAMSNYSQQSKIEPLSTILSGYIGRVCTLKTSLNRALFLNNYGKAKYEVLDVDANWIQIRYEENREFKEMAIRISDITSVSDIN